MNQQSERIGFTYGFLGVLGFSLTLPATRAAVTDLDPVIVGIGRALVAAGLASIVLLVRRQAPPHWRFLPQFAIVIAGVVIGFPFLSAVAMKDVPASYGAVITGLLPLATALAGVWRAKERPSAQFWLFAIVGSSLVIGFALSFSTRTLDFADFALLGAVAAAGLGYAEGAILARRFGGWQVICWSLVLSIPVLLAILLVANVSLPTHLSVRAGLGFAYVSMISMFLAFFAWYQGLAIGGIARVGQVQLIQPFLTILGSAVLLGEPLTPQTLGFAGGVTFCVAMGRRAPIRAADGEN
ncbi:DMT family transporter [Leptolyngbya sp. AN03gr2]|uniref:DMT family transporter n=1 Tax=unclassified Leptolyngbya TaxID=2650499 RepID=UPI003D321EB6